MNFDVWTGLQQVGRNISYVAMTGDILTMRHGLRNMVRRRNQARFCNALPLRPSQAGVSLYLRICRGAGVLQIPQFGSSHFVNHQGGLSQPMLQ